MRIELSSVNQASNKIHGILMCHQWRRVSSSNAIFNHWSQARMPSILSHAWLTELNLILTMAAHSEEFASLAQKYQTCLILSSRPPEANSSPKFPCSREKCLSKPPLETVCSTLSLSVRRALRSQLKIFVLMLLYSNLVKYLRSFLCFLSNVEKWMLIAKK